MNLFPETSNKTLISDKENLNKSIRSGYFDIIFKGIIEPNILMEKIFKIRDVLTNVVLSNHNKISIETLVAFIKKEESDPIDNSITQVRIFFCFSKAISCRPMSTFYNPLRTLNVYGSQTVDVLDCHIYRTEPGILPEFFLKNFESGAEYILMGKDVIRC